MYPGRGVVDWLWGCRGLDRPEDRGLRGRCFHNCSGGVFRGVGSGVSLRRLVVVAFGFFSVWSL